MTRLLRGKPDQRTLFQVWCKAEGFPSPTPEYAFAKPRRWRFDYAWPAQMIALEVEGGVWTQGRHTRGSGYMADLVKYNQAAVRGWCVLRVVPAELFRTETRDLLAAAFASASHRSHPQQVSAPKTFSLSRATP